MLILNIIFIIKKYLKYKEKIKLIILIQLFKTIEFMFLK